MSYVADFGVLPPAGAIYRGDAWLLPIADSVNLTTFGSAFQCQMRASEDATTYVTVTVDASGASAGNLALSLTAAATAAMTGTQYVCDVQATGGTLSPITLYRFVVPFVKDVTR